jgi:hypothetical protein
MKAFPVRMPSGVRYWTVLDDDLDPVPVADAFLRNARFGRDQAESTTKTYAGALVLFLHWCQATDRDWRTAASELGLFMLWLRHTPVGAEAAVVRPGHVRNRSLSDSAVR